MILTFVVIKRGDEVLLRRLSHWKNDLKDLGYEVLHEGTCRECKDYIDNELGESLSFVEGGFDND